MVAVTISDLAHTQLGFLDRDSAAAQDDDHGHGKALRALGHSFDLAPRKILVPGPSLVDTTMPRVTVSLYASEKSTERPTFAATRSASALQADRGPGGREAALRQVPAARAAEAEISTSKKARNPYDASGPALALASTHRCRRVYGSGNGRRLSVDHSTA